MHGSAPSYDIKNFFASLRNRNVVCYNCNKIGHKGYECRKKIFQSSGNPSTFSFNNNVRNNNYGHHERVGRVYARHEYAWNKYR